MRILLTISLLLSFSLKAETVKVHVPGMVCQMCVQGMQKQFGSAVKNTETDVLVDLDTKMVTVKTINAITDADIKKRVQNAGYNAAKIERLDKSSNFKAKRSKIFKRKKDK